jgi:hypothetical protein
MFAAAAFHSIAIAASLLAAPARFAQHIALTGPGAPFAVSMIAVLWGALGIGYAIVATAPQRNRAIVWAGLAAKAGIASLAALQFAAETIPYRYFALAMSDVVLAALFAVFLWRARR